MPRKAITGVPLQSLESIDLSSQDETIKEAMGRVDVLKGIRYVKVGRRGYEHLEERPIARTLIEAQEQGWDWFSPFLKTWIRGGFKPENDPPDLHGVPFIPPAPDEIFVPQRISDAPNSI